MPVFLDRDRKGCADARRAFNSYASAVLLDNAPYNCKPQPRTFLLCGIERLENPVNIPAAYAASRVRYAYGEFIACAAGGYGEHAARFHGFNGIFYDIKESMLQFFAVA